MVHSFEDIVVKVGGDEIYCQSASVDYSASVSPNINTKSKYGFSYHPDSAPQGNIKLSYYLTGVDPMYSYVIDENQSIAVDVGGLTVGSGYLGSYSFSIEESNPLLVDVSISFFEKMGGSLQASQSSLGDIEFLNSVNVSLSNGNYISHSDLTSLSYDYGTQVEPYYSIEEGHSDDEILPSSVKFKQKEVNLSFKSYKEEITIPVTGLHEMVTINLENRAGNTVASYYVNGIINEKTLGTSSSELLEHTYGVDQANLGGSLPIAASLSDLMVDVGDTVTLAGSNLDGLESVSYLGFDCEVISNNAVSIVFKVSDHAYLSGIGPVEVATKAGLTSTLSSMQITGDSTSRSWSNALF
jgi:hypothetical protein